MSEMFLNVQECIQIPLHANSKVPKIKWDKLAETPSSNLFIDSNIGLLAGNKFVVVDIDVKDDGLSTWTQWTKEYGAPLTVTQRTPSGGVHYFFQPCPLILDQKIIKINANGKRVGIDIIAGNSYVTISPSTINSKAYKWIKSPSDVPLAEIPKWLIHKIIMHHGATQKVEKPKVIKEKPKHSNIKAININEADVEKALKSLPIEYCNNLNKWLCITGSLKSANLFDIWDKWSQQSPKYNREKNYKTWETLEPRTDINWLMHLANEKPIIPFISLTMKNIRTEIINHRYLPFLLYQTYDTVIVKSDTGTGKTTSTAKYYNEFCKGKKLMSIVSRVCLGNQQVESFAKHGIDAKLYSAKDVNLSSDNLVIQVDSLIKIQDKKDFSDYVVYLDEANSLLQYTLHSDTLGKKRAHVAKILKDIMDSAHKVIATDADISDIVIKYFDLRRKNKTKIFYINEFKNYQGIPAIEYTVIDNICNRMKELISKNEPFLATFDTKSQLEVVLKLVLDETKKNMFISHTSDFSSSDIKNVSEKWKNKFVFYSPQILYGVDFVPDISEEVFTFITNKSINPQQVVQQIARNRKIKRLNFHCPVQPKSSKFTSLDAVIKDVENNKMAYWTILKEIGAIYQDEDEEAQLVSNNTFLQLYYIDMFFDDILRSNFKYHFINILKEKGFNVIEAKENSTTSGLNTSALRKQIKEEKEQNFEKYLTDNDDAMILSTSKERMKLLHLEDKDADVKRMFSEEILTNKAFENHIHAVNLMRTNDINLGKLVEKKKNEFVYKAMVSSQTKIAICGKIESALGIDRLDIDSEKHTSRSDEPVEISDDVFQLYKHNFRSKMEKPKTWKETYHLLIKAYKHMVPSIIKATKKTVRVGKNKFTTVYTYKTEKETLEHNLNLLHHREPTYYSIRENLLAITNKQKTQFENIDNRQYMF